ncbi:hypothetical protein AMATHDRAFT_70123 [Amanita thiersii Skay4041]|uniref:NADP-dependent oxidoreductase domain-containing protein n=1 Tax=Amanita thiersii Skay4041 TaxID=703135 RepID=A0A2A9NF46_9AGAR|nr:hypothetical protein AMATHDRAFT_70123 [Amanita thiersii Skay4041]
MASRFQLLDGTSIPWLGWGNGSGRSNHDALRCGRLALEAGIRHIDTAQVYKTESETGQCIVDAGVNRDEMYITSKLSKLPGDISVPLDQVRPLIEESKRKLGCTPDLFLIHNPTVARPGELKAMWKILEDMKSSGELKSIGVSNFRPQDIEEILDGAIYKPVVNQIEYHPFTLTHLEPLLALQKKHNILTQSYGPLTPLLRHPTNGGPLIPILTRIAHRLSTTTTTPIDTTTILLLWCRAQGVIPITTSANPTRITHLAAIYSTLPPNLLTPDEIQQITDVGKKVHFRHYTEHMEKDFPLPNLPNDLPLSPT